MPRASLPTFITDVKEQLLQLGLDRAFLQALNDAVTSAIAAHGTPESITLPDIPADTNPNVTAAHSLLHTLFSQCLTQYADKTTDIVLLQCLPYLRLTKLARKVLQIATINLTRPEVRHNFIHGFQEYESKAIHVARRESIEGESQLTREDLDLLAEPILADDIMIAYLTTRNPEGERPLPGTYTLEDIFFVYFRLKDLFITQLTLTSPLSTLLTPKTPAPPPPAIEASPADDPNDALLTRAKELLAQINVPPMESIGVELGPPRSPRASPNPVEASAAPVVPSPVIDRLTGFIHIIKTTLVSLGLHPAFFSALEERSRFLLATDPRWSIHHARPEPPPSPLPPLPKPKLTTPLTLAAQKSLATLTEQYATRYGPTISFELLTILPILKLMAVARQQRYQLELKRLPAGDGKKSYYSSDRRADEFEGELIKLTRLARTASLETLPPPNTKTQIRR